MVYENEESEREQAINEWLPVTSKRDAKWWYSAFHNVTAMVGAGVLSLRYAMAQLGWGYHNGLIMGCDIVHPLANGANARDANIFVVIHVIGSYQLPCFMWLSICKPKRFSTTWFINWICIILGVLLMVLSPIGGLRSIIVSAKDYKFFS
ncbi:hypothetical protein GQ457_03G009080 [Hibiscus cannabinus]